MLLLMFLQPLEAMVKESAATSFIQGPCVPSRRERLIEDETVRRHFISKNALLETLGEMSRWSESIGNHRRTLLSEEPLKWRRTRRGTEDEDSKPIQKYIPGVKVEFPRPINPASLRPTKALVPSSTDPLEQRQRSPAVHGGTEPHNNVTVASEKRSQIQNPLYPVTESSYSAYAVMFLSLIVFAVGIIGNLSVMCIVWHNYYMKSAWNSILASLAFWDFLILFFCLPVVIFNEITKKRLLGSISCRIVPFMEVEV
uniref:Uncharacterized protein n=1 Tax=Sphaerodactylus townsendi TaxID=933632 RepID=A0ACB8F5C3_9SAUR